jgi:hypothetical protein
MSLNKQRFIENFGITFEMPTYLYKGALFWPADRNYLLAMGNFVFPKNMEVHNKQGDTQLPPSQQSRNIPTETELKSDKTVFNLYHLEQGSWVSTNANTLNYYFQGPLIFSENGSFLAVKKNESSI